MAKSAPQASKKGAWTLDEGKDGTAGSQMEKEAEIGSLWNSYAENTGLHGINKLHGNTASGFRKLFWLLVVLGMTGYLVYQLATGIQFFYSYTTFTDIKVHQVEELEFPSVTVCNLSPFNSSFTSHTEWLYQAGMTTLGQLYNLVNYSDPMFDTPVFHYNFSVEDVANSGMKLENMLLYCYFDTAFLPCSSIFSLVMMADGPCFTFNSDVNNVRKTQLSGDDVNLRVFIYVDQQHYRINDFMSAGVKVLVHPAGTLATAASTSFYAPVGFLISTALKKTRYTYLPAPYTAFGSKQCLDTESVDFVNPLTYYEVYTYGHCMMECRARYYMSVCGCLSSTDPPFGPLCTMRRLADCGLQFWLFRVNDTLQETCGCQHTCHSVDYEADVSMATFPSKSGLELFDYVNFTDNVSTISENYLELRVYYSKLRFTAVDQKPQYTMDGILASLGGTMGLCLGASILSVAELLEFLVFLLASLCRRRRAQRAAAAVGKTAHAQVHHLTVDDFHPSPFALDGVPDKGKF